MRLYHEDAKLKVVLLARVRDRLCAPTVTWAPHHCCPDRRQRRCTGNNQTDQRCEEVRMLIGIERGWDRGRRSRL